MKKAKGILLYSGGLDSLLAAKLLLEQNLEIIGLHFLLPFFPPHSDPAETKAALYAQRIGLKVEHIRTGNEYMEMLKNPSYGYGKNMNPCVDCKIFFLRYAADYMKEHGYDFIATGEVVGQRPMSQQRNKMNLIEKEAYLKDFLLRPLSAKLLNPIKAEREGLIDREKLLDFNGRGRDRQFALAREYGIEEYASPAGGCLFTDVTYSARLKDLFLMHPDYRDIDIYLLSIGRHYRLSPSCKLIVSRNAEETAILDKYSIESDIFLISNFRGPAGFIRGNASESDLGTAYTVLYRHGKPDAGKINEITVRKNNCEFTVTADKAAEDLFLDSVRIA